MMARRYKSVRTKADATAFLVACINEAVAGGAAPWGDTPDHIESDPGGVLTLRFGEHAFRVAVTHEAGGKGEGGTHAVR